MSNCNGCPLDTPAFDHRHQYINPFGHCIMITQIDGNTYQSEHAAFRYLRDELGWDSKDALEYIKIIPLKLN